MRAILTMAHCHGDILGTAWYLTLNTLQHLTIILGLKPATGGGLKAIQANELPTVVSQIIVKVSNSFQTSVTKFLNFRSFLEKHRTV